jgi:hypothetical protein
MVATTYSELTLILKIINMKWEYLTQYWSVNLLTLSDKLNALGKERWELVEFKIVHASVFDKDYVLIFKRPKE